MRRLSMIVVCVAVGGVATGCGTATSGGSGTQTAPVVAKRPGTPYVLYDHCGIEWARIRGTWWRAERPLSDGSGNPPAGWGDPEQPGTITFPGHDTAQFHAIPGTITFHRTARTRPPFVCS